MPGFFSRRRSQGEGDPAVRQYFEAVRDELRARGTMAQIDPALGCIYIVDAKMEKPGYVVWAVYETTWSGYLHDAREINLRRRGIGVRPGAAEAAAHIGPAPNGLMERLVDGGAHRHRRQAYDRVYGRNGTGIELVDYPNPMNRPVTADFEGIDMYEPHDVANRMMKAMLGMGIQFTGESHITWPDRCGESIPQPAVTVTPELKARWHDIGPQRLTWKSQPIGGTSFTMPEPAPLDLHL